MLDSSPARPSPPASGTPERSSRSASTRIAGQQLDLTSLVTHPPRAKPSDEVPRGARFRLEPQPSAPPQTPSIATSNPSNEIAVACTNGFPPDRFELADTPQRLRHRYRSPRLRADQPLTHPTPVERRGSFRVHQALARSVEIAEPMVRARDLAVPQQAPRRREPASSASRSRSRSTQAPVESSLPAHRTAACTVLNRSSSTSIRAPSPASSFASALTAEHRASVTSAPAVSRAPERRANSSWNPIPVQRPRARRVSTARSEQPRRRQAVTQVLPRSALPG